MKHMLCPFCLLAFIIPMSANAETCIDFDDDGQFIEYNCGASQSAENRKTESTQTNHKLCGQENCKSISPFLGVGITRANNGLSGFAGEVGIKYRELPYPWHSTLSVIVEKGSHDDTLHYDNGNPFTIKSEKTSVNVAVGMGYYLTKSLDVYTKVTVGVYKAKVSGYVFSKEVPPTNPNNNYIEYREVAAEDATPTKFDLGLIIGVNQNILRCLNLFAEAQILPFGFNGTVENNTNATVQELNIHGRIGIRINF